MSTAITQRLAEFRRASGLESLFDLAEFCKVEPETATAWLGGGALPNGEKLVRLQFYLQLRGLTLSELDELPPPAYMLGESIALDLVDISDAVTALGYTGGYTNGLYGLLRGKSAQPDKIRKMEELVESLAVKRAEARVRFALDRNLEQPAPEPTANVLRVSDHYRDAGPRGIGRAALRSVSSYEELPDKAERFTDPFGIDPVVQATAASLGALIRMDGRTGPDGRVSLDDTSREVLESLSNQLMEFLT